MREENRAIALCEGARRVRSEERLNIARARGTGTSKGKGMGEKREKGTMSFAKCKEVRAKREM